MHIVLLFVYTEAFYCIIYVCDTSLNISFAGFRAVELTNVLLFGEVHYLQYFKYTLVETIGYIQACMQACIHRVMFFGYVMIIHLVD